MEMTNKLNNIPAEKFRFAQKSDLHHDSKFDTKPISYFQGAFSRFCKNKGAVVAAVVIAILVLFAIIAPFCTPFEPAYFDQTYAHVTPGLNFFKENDIHFWDGGREKEANKNTYLKDLALQTETGREIIMTEPEISDDGSIYSYRYDTVYGVGFGKYKIITMAEYEDIQEYQNATGRQVLYPTVNFYDRPTVDTNQVDANIYYKVQNQDSSIIRPLLVNGEIVPNYWTYNEGSMPKTAAPYDSQRIEGDGENGVYYVYGRKMAGDTVEVRAEYYEYYIYQHTQVLKDGIEEPVFWFGTTDMGKDIFACLSYGARFSFIFAIIVAVVNLVVGVIWGSIAGYYGGRIDLLMERFTDILGSVPTMIVITLMKYHMGTSSQVLVLMLSFFLTGWIGMAGRTRMQFYRFKNQEYVLAARTLGATDRRVMFKHIFPNGLGTLVTSCALIIPSMIYSETSLSYLGIINLEAGNTTSVGTLIAAGQRSIIANAGHVALFPCAFLVLLMLSFNLFGNGLRDAFNPSLRGSEE